MNQQYVDLHQGIRGGAKLKVVVVAAIVLAGLATYKFLSRPHSHLFHESLPPFAQKLFEPASFIYGSSIHVWAYKDEEGVEEIAVTGHADGPTCREMTGLVFNAYLEKQDRPDDLFVAGAARLIAGNVDHSQSGQALAKYKELLADENLNERMLTVFARVPTEGTNGESGLAQMKRHVNEEKEQLKRMEADPTISQYVGIIKSRSSLAGFAREVSNLAESSGLVELHTLPVAMLVEARQRIKNTVATKTPTLARFDDLLHKYKVAEAVMLQDVLRPGSGEPLVFRIPLNDLSADGFEEAKKLNRSEVESSMVGDAERRRRFYEDQIAKFSEEKERCKHMSAAELREKIVLNQRCSPDGFCYSVSDDEKTTRADYCADTVPRNLDIVHEWMGSVAELLSNIKKDQERTGTVA